MAKDIIGLSAYDKESGGADHIEVTGNIPRLKQILGEVEIPTGLTFDTRITMQGVDGFPWEVWGGQTFFYNARRQRTPEEREEWIDDLNSRSYCSWFSSDRLAICRVIAVEVQALAELLSDDKVPSRERRRAMRRQLTAMGHVQWCLTTGSKYRAKLAREHLAEVGVVVTQQNRSQVGI